MIQNPPHSCPACARTATRPSSSLIVKNVGELPILRCADCGHLWIATNSDQQRKIEESYSEEYSGYREDPYLSKVLRAELAGRFARLAPPPAAVLDVGCGNGQFLGLAKEAGYEVQGIDVSESAAGMCRKRGIPAFSGDFLTAQFSRRYDLVTLWDVTEHLREPARFLGRARDLLNPNGILVLKIPSYGALNFYALKVFRNLNGLLQAPSHCQFFCRSSLAALLKREGYGEITWIPPMQFRDVPQTGSLLKRIKRSIRGQVAKVAGNHNLYCIVKRSS